ALGGNAYNTSAQEDTPSSWPSSDDIEDEKNTEEDLIANYAELEPSPRRTHKKRHRRRRTSKAPRNTEAASMAPADASIGDTSGEVEDDSMSELPYAAAR